MVHNRAYVHGLTQHGSFDMPRSHTSRCTEYTAVLSFTAVLYAVRRKWLPLYAMPLTTGLALQHDRLDILNEVDQLIVDTATTVPHAHEGTVQPAKRFVNQYRHSRCNLSLPDVPRLAYQPCSQRAA